MNWFGGLPLVKQKGKVNIALNVKQLEELKYGGFWFKHQVR
jgi:hypothetical protein